MDFNQSIEIYALGTLPVEDLPAAAVDALTAGYDSPSLFQLAGAEGADFDDIKRLFRAALDELGLEMPAPIDAAYSAARRIAAGIVQGTVTPYAGAKQIWTKIYTGFPQLAELRTFVGAASEYEDDLAHQEEYSRLIIEESKKLLSKPTRR